MSSATQVREATFDDAPSIASIHAQSWRENYIGLLSQDFLDNQVENERLELWTQRLGDSAPDRIILVATSTDRIQGFACLCLDSDPLWGTHLENLHVAGDQKGRGIGRSLMNAVAAKSLAVRPEAKLYLWVLEANESARMFYRHLGGEEADRDFWEPPDGSKVPEVRMVWVDPRVLVPGTSR